MHPFKHNEQRAERSRVCFSYWTRNSAASSWLIEVSVFSLWRNVNGLALRKKEKQLKYLLIILSCQIHHAAPQKSVRKHCKALEQANKLHVSHEPCFAFLFEAQMWTLPVTPNYRNFASFSWRLKMNHKMVTSSTFHSWEDIWAPRHTKPALTHIPKHTFITYSISS